MEELSIRNPGAMAATAQRIALEVQRERKARAHGKGDKSKKIPPVGLGSGGNTTALRTMTIADRRSAAIPITTSVIQAMPPGGQVSFA